MFQDFNLVDILVTLPGILIGLTFHEFAHAYTSYKFGDPTPLNQGRLTTNPLKHLDLWGFLFLLIAGFGWAKPVQINTSYYKTNVKRKTIIVSLAGPLTNLAIAIITGAIIYIFFKLELFYIVNQNTAGIIAGVLYQIVWINCVLFIFNIIPIPPLDGFGILVELIPGISSKIVFNMQRYGSIILMVFILTPLSDIVIGKGAGGVFDIIMKLFSI